MEQDGEIPASGPKGFSLVELLVALAIAALLLGAAAPSYARWIAEQRLLGEARRLAHGLELARAEAIKRNARIEICATSIPGDCTTGAGWHHGYLTFQDLDGNDRLDAGERPIAFEPASPTGISIVGNAGVASHVGFTYAGQARRADGALQMGTFTVCQPGLRAINVVLANSGRIRIDRTTAVCA